MGSAAALAAHAQQLLLAALLLQVCERLAVPRASPATTAIPWHVPQRGIIIIILRGCSIRSVAATSSGSAGSLWGAVQAPSGLAREQHIRRRKARGAGRAAVAALAAVMALPLLLMRATRIAAAASVAGAAAAGGGGGSSSLVQLQQLAVPAQGAVAPCRASTCHHTTKLQRACGHSARASRASNGGSGCLRDVAQLLRHRVPSRLAGAVQRLHQLLVAQLLVLLVLLLLLLLLELVLLLCVRAHL
jgi:hypothetical protein